MSRPTFLNVPTPLDMEDEYDKNVENGVVWSC